MKQAKIFLNNALAGILTEDDLGYEFRYDSDYLKDDEELALTLNDKKKRIKQEDFEKALRDSGMDEKAIANIFARFSKAIPKWLELINVSFLPTDLQEAYHDNIDTMSKRISISK